MVSDWKGNQNEVLRASERRIVSTEEFSWWKTCSRDPGSRSKRHLVSCWERRDSHEGRVFLLWPLTGKLVASRGFTKCIKFLV